MKNVETLGKVIKTDVLVLGAGGAGMCAALKAAETGQSVLLVDKCGVGYGGQVPIGGGILGYVYPDYAETWAARVTRDSFFFNNQDWTYAFGKAMHQSTCDLRKMGLTFLQKDGDIDVLTWGPHVHVTLFDAPKSLLALKKTARARGVKMMDKIYAVDLLLKDGRVAGAAALGLADGKTYLFNAKSVVIATGNCGYMHEKTYSSVQGEGAAMGWRAGAELVNAEFSSSYVWGVKALGKELMGLHFYLKLENARGEPIMGKYYPELMTGKHSVYTFDPRVIDAMQQEIRAGLGPIYLNLQGLTDKEIADLAEDQDVPGLTHLLANDTMSLLREKAGIDPAKEKMEMWPRYLYSGGGLCIDTAGRTTLEGLYAAGGASSNCWSGGGGGQAGLGVQSAAVTGFTAGAGAAAYARENPRLDIDAAQAGQVLERVMAPLRRLGEIDASAVAYRVHEAVVPMKYNRRREAGRLREALGIVEDAREKLAKVGAADFHDLSRYHAAESMALAAEFTFRAALLREESRAGHFREDFPQRDDRRWFKWITVRRQDGRPVLDTLPVPVKQYRLQP